MVETDLEACKKKDQNFADVLHYTTACKLFFKLKQMLEFLKTAFAVILTPVALAIVPKLEFDFEEHVQYCAKVKQAKCVHFILCPCELSKKVLEKVRVTIRGLLSEFP